MNIIEKNKIIVSFMGDSFQYYKESFPDDELDFDSSWDWLMPTLQKYNKIYGINLLFSGNPFVINHKFNLLVN